MIKAEYRTQVDLLLQILPYVAKEDVFALKGGTAINLFIRDLPRLSVDIDLTYLPIDSREKALGNIHNALGRIKKKLESAIKGLTVHSVPLQNGSDSKLNCQHTGAQIKIEVNTITRGHIFPVRLMQVADKVQDEFGKFAAINIVSHAELYGGKICAALDRQHPRDLFDVKLLFENEGLSYEVRQGFIVGLLSHYKPIHELINPILKDQQSAYESQFSGMTSIAFSYDDYTDTRDLLIKTIKTNLAKDEKDLIYGFENGNPEWKLFPHEIVQNLPAVQWKLSNINKLKKENSQKHEQLMENLEKVLFS